MQTGAKFVWRSVGSFLFLLGLMGLIIPLFPTTVFWILAALALQRSDPAFAERIRAWPQIGPEVANFLDFGVVSPLGKFAALSAMAASGTLSAFFLDDAFALGATLGVLGLVSLYIATRPSRLTDEAMARRIPAPIGSTAPQTDPKG